MMSMKGPRRLLLILLSMLITCSAWIPGVQLAAGSQSSDGWTVASYSPNIGDYAVAVTGAGESIYIANSTKTAVNYFMHYNTVDNNWYSVSNPSQWFKNGTALAWDGGNHIYALMGASYNDIEGGGRFYFYRYSISGNSWTKLADTPHTCGPGDAITFVPGSVLGVSDDNFLYAILGSNKKPSGSRFYRYSIASGSWSAALSFLWDDNTDDGCSLVWTGDNYLYALRGEYDEKMPSRDFARFKLTDNTWENLPPIPDYGGVGDGGSMLWVGGGYSDYVYALGGGGANEVPGKKFFCYKIPGNSWIELADLPDGVTDQTGSRLGFSEGNIYAWRGTFGDKVLWGYSPVHPNVVTLTPTDDSFVHYSRPNDTFGSWDTIYIGRYTNSAERGFLKFDLSGIPDNNVVDVKLYLYCWGVDGGGANIQGHRVDNDNWYEGTITWNNMPAIGGILDGPNSVDNRGQYSWTVTDFVAEQLTGDKIASFCLIDADENVAPDHDAKFDSKEWDDNFQWPYLKITYAPLYGVDVSILPDNQSGLPGGTLSYVVTVTNAGQLDDNYDLTISDDASWGLSISPTPLEVPAGENGSATLSVTISENATPCTSDEITVTATSQSDPLVSDSATCIARRVEPIFGLGTIYEVSLEFDAYVDQGSKLVLKFYNYADNYQGENTVWSGPVPDNVSFSKIVPHPENAAVENVKLVLTGEDTQNVITTVGTFTVRRSNLIARISAIKGRWPFADDDERSDLIQEISAIKGKWPFAPS